MLLQFQLTQHGEYWENVQLSIGWSKVFPREEVKMDML